MTLEYAVSNQWTKVNNKIEKAWELKVGQISLEFAERNENKHEGPT
jgi:hypothetical protein